MPQEPSSATKAPTGPLPPGEAARGLAALVRHYAERHAALEAAGTGPYRMTALGAWATSRAKHLFHFFKELPLSRFRLFLDLGSGDGIAVCTAALFTRAAGIEIDSGLCREAAESARKLDLAHRTTFIQGDLFSQNIAAADCLFIYPDKPVQPILKRLSGRSRTLLVYGPHLPPEGLSPVRILTCGNERLTVYVTPLEG